MRFMVLVKADKNSEAGVMPDEKLLTEMGKFNEELVKAGVMLAGEGLHPSSKGARVRFSGDKRTVIDGPFAETKELIAGYWLWQVQVARKRRSSGSSAAPTRCRARVGDRDPPGVRGRGLRRRVHARAAGAGRAPARADRREEVRRVSAPGRRGGSWLSAHATVARTCGLAWLIARVNGSTAPGALSRPRLPAAVFTTNSSSSSNARMRPSAARASPSSPRICAAMRRTPSSR